MELPASGKDERLTALDLSTLTPRWTIDQIPHWSTVLAADLDGDRKAEVLSGTQGGVAVSGEGKILAHPRADENFFRLPLAADLKGDGSLDLVTGNPHRRLRILSGKTGKEIWKRDPGMPAGSARSWRTSTRTACRRSSGARPAG